MFVICNSIKKKEIESMNRFFSIKQIKAAAIKAKTGLGVVLSSTIIPKIFIF